MIFSSCAKCNNEEPTARVLNNGSTAANVQITASNGDIISITELSSGLISSVKSYSAGNASINASIDGSQLSQSLNMEECVSYDITITSENEIVVFSQEKD